MIQKVRKLFVFLFLISNFAFVVSSDKSIMDGLEESEEDLGEEFWGSQPIELDCVKIQILDKISGNVYRGVMKLNVPKRFGSIILELKRCFQNAPEDSKEIFAFMEVMEKEKVIFANWIFASSPSINLFSHPVYDIRIEF